MTRRGNLIGTQVSAARNRLGLSQAGLAANCQRMGWDVSRDVLARIESGIRGVSDKEMAIFSEALGVSPQELLPDKIARGYVQSLKD